MHNGDDKQYFYNGFHKKKGAVQTKSFCAILSALCLVPRVCPVCPPRAMLCSLRTHQMLVTLLLEARKVN